MDSKSELLSMGGIGPQLHLVVFLRSAHGLYGPQNDSMQNQNKIPITSNGSIGSQPADLIICRFWYIGGGYKSGSPVGIVIQLYLHVGKKKKN